MLGAEDQMQHGTTEHIQFKEKYNLAKDDLIKMSGVVDECLPSATFRVTLENGHKILATIGGRLRQNNIRILMGDRVDIELSTYDLSRGRVVYRNK